MQKQNNINHVYAERNRTSTLRYIYIYIYIFTYTYTCAKAQTALDLITSEGNIKGL